MYTFVELEERFFKSRQFNLTCEDFPTKKTTNKEYAWALRARADGYDSDKNCLIKGC